MGLIVLETGNLIGCDIVGGVWRGTYHHDPKLDKIVCNMEVTYPTAGVSVLSGPIAAGGKDNFTILLPKELGATHTEVLPTSMGHVSVIFRRIMDAF